MSSRLVEKMTAADLDMNTKNEIKVLIENDGPGRKRIVFNIDLVQHMLVDEANLEGEDSEELIRTFIFNISEALVEVFQEISDDYDAEIPIKN